MVVVGGLVGRGGGLQHDSDRDKKIPGQMQGFLKHQIYSKISFSLLSAYCIEMLEYFVFIIVGKLREGVRHTNMRIEQNRMYITFYLK